MENHNTHLAPGFILNVLVPAPANVAAFQGLLRPGGFNSLHQMSFQQWNCFSLCGLRTSRTPLCSWGFALPTGAPPGIELRSCRLCAPPLFTVLMEFKPSPFSLFSLVPAAVSNFPLSLQLLLGRGAFPKCSPPPQSLFSLAGKRGYLPFGASCSPSSPLQATYLLNSVVQVVQIVVLILRSVY